MSFAATQYRTAHVSTATPIQLVVQLYDASIRFLIQAQSDHEAKNITVCRENLRKAQAIVSELQSSLITEHAPELCSDLDRLYEFVLHCITKTFLGSEGSSLPAAINVLRDLRGAWAELAHRS